MSPRLLAGLRLALLLVIPVSCARAAVVDAAELDAPPERIGYRPAVYPPALAADGGPVDVKLSVVIDLDGSVRSIEQVQAPRPEFEAPARTAVEGWKFQPGYVKGMPTYYRLAVVVPFRTEGVGGGLDVSPGPGDAVVVSEPVVEWEVPPAYPAALAAEPRDGLAVVNVLIDAIGTPSDPVVEYASHPAFAAPAAEAVLAWRFTSAERGDQPVMTRTHLIVRFRKDDAKLTANDRQTLAQLKQARSYDVAPEALIQVPLVYPYDALLQGQRGLAAIAVLVSPEGQVARIEPEPGSSGEFTLAAMSCVTCWSFHPATKLDQPVFGWVRWELVFTDNSSELQFDDVSRELLTALRAGTLQVTPGRELDKPITPRERIMPRVPPGSAAGFAGDVVIEVLIDRNGRAQFPRIVRAPAPELGYAAATAAARWRFEPPRKGGEPVTVRVRIPFQFSATPAPAAEDAPAKAN